MARPIHVVTVAGPPAVGKTSVLLKALRSAGSLRCGVAKFDCLNGMELTTAKVRALIDAPLDDGRITKGSVKGRVCYWLA